MASTERAFTVSGGVISYGATLSSYQYRYDACSNLTRLTCSVAGTTWSTTYTYDDDNRPKTTTLSGGTVITNTYDTLGRRASGDPPGREPKTGPERQKVRRLPSVRSDLPESCHHIRQKENSKEGMNPFRQKDR